VWFDYFNTSLAFMAQTLVLEEDGQEPLIGCNHIFPIQTGENYGVLNTYSPIITSLRESGYEVRFFPFDWRLDLEDNANILDQQINTWGYDKVILIGHSMGGLLARTYVENPAYAAKVEKVITVAAPYLGAPDLAWFMRTGEIPMLEKKLGVKLGIAAIADIIRNSPGSMQLLPSDKYFQTFPSYSYFSYSYFQLWPPETIVTYLYGLSETNDYFKTHPGLYGTQNGQLLDEASVYHNKYDDFSTISVDYHVLSAANLPTTVHIRQNESCILGIGCLETIGYGIGDGTVPRNSAIYLGTLSDNVHVYPPYNMDEGFTSDHIEMINDTTVIKDIKAILSGMKIREVELLAAQASAPPSPFIELVVLGSAEVRVTDDAGYTSGVNAEGVIVDDIPWATFKTSSNYTEVVLPSDRAYTVTIKQVGEIPLQVKVSELTAPSYEGVFTASYQVIFDAVPLSMDGIAAISLDLAAGLDSLTLSVFNAGEPEQVIQPSSVVDVKE
jgi:pimeloyl-ACP methyl ester carboxylesterase